MTAPNGSAWSQIPEMGIHVESIVTVYDPGRLGDWIARLPQSLQAELLIGLSEYVDSIGGPAASTQLDLIANHVAKYPRVTMAVVCDFLAGLAGRLTKPAEGDAS